ncbi:single-stranded DNA-binding protein [Falsibacillus pallidus]|uniref:single-stranded DNA-binding protein n=1 Tax=Falsibacillus pallidus TaxID=493781 RepID=UPI003D989F15
MINQVTIVGRLTRTPDLKYTTDGKPVLNVTVAVNRPYRNSNGEMDADFVLCTLWNRTAENTAKYCDKGSVIGVTGRIQTRNYENSDGKKVYVTEIMADSVKFLGGRPIEDRELQAVPTKQH